uniref:Uncharacterized protein n=1 Tax=Arundo donax TaxID=35708 RepID=A0A0A9BX46_ARUDO
MSTAITQHGTLPAPSVISRACIAAGITVGNHCRTTLW